MTIMNPAAMTCTYLTPRSQHGLSLVELMISLTVGLVLVTGITTLIVQQSSSRNELEKSSRQIENGRYAMQILHDDIQLAGFYGEYSPASGVTYTVPADPCAISTNSGWSNTPTVPVPIYGYAGGATDPTTTPAPTCGGLTNYKPNTAILVVRRTATATVATAAAVAGTTYLQVSRCSPPATPFVLGTGGFTLLQKNCATPALLRQYLVNVYYISTCDVCGMDTIPTLKMVQAGPAAAPSLPIPLVEGIENMQFDYGVDNTSDGSPDAYTTSPAATDWQNIMAVRVNLLARNTECTTGYTDSKSYNMGLAGSASAPASTCTNGDYKRHVYTELVRAVNPSGWRESP